MSQGQPSQAPRIQSPIPAVKIDDSQGGPQGVKSIAAPIPADLPPSRPEVPPITVDFGPSEDVHEGDHDPLRANEPLRDSAEQDGSSPSVDSPPQGPDARREFAKQIASAWTGIVMAGGKKMEAAGWFSLNPFLEAAQFEKCVESVVYDIAPVDMDPTKVAKWVVVIGSSWNVGGAIVVTVKENKAKAKVQTANDNKATHAKDPNVNVRVPGSTEPAPKPANNNQHAEMGLHGPGEENEWQQVMGGLSGGLSTSQWGS